MRRGHRGRGYRWRHCFAPEQRGKYGKVLWTLRNLALDAVSIVEFIDRSWPTPDEARTMNRLLPVMGAATTVSSKFCLLFVPESHTPKQVIHYPDKFKDTAWKLIIIHGRSTDPADVESVDAVGEPEIVCQTKSAREVAVYVLSHALQ